MDPSKNFQSVTAYYSDVSGNSTRNSILGFSNQSKPFGTLFRIFWEKSTDKIHYQFRLPYDYLNSDSPEWEDLVLCRVSLMVIALPFMQVSIRSPRGEIYNTLMGKPKYFGQAVTELGPVSEVPVHKGKNPFLI